MSSDQKSGSFTRGWSSIGRIILDLERERERGIGEEVGWGLKILLSEMLEIGLIFKIPEVSDHAAEDAEEATGSRVGWLDSDDVCAERSDVCLEVSSV